MARTIWLTVFPLLFLLLSLPGCEDNHSSASAASNDLLNQHEQAFERYLGLIDEAAQVLKSASEHRDNGRAVKELDDVVGRMNELANEVQALEPLDNDQMRVMNEKLGPEIQPVMQQMREGMEQVVVIASLKQAMDPSMQRLKDAINSVNSPTVEQRAQGSPVPSASRPSDDSAKLTESPSDPVAPSAYVVIQNAGPRDPQLLVRQLQQVLPKTQVVKQVQSPDPREIRLEVTNIKDLRALANKIPFAALETVDDRTRTITVDFDL